MPLYHDDNTGKVSLHLDGVLRAVPDPEVFHRLFSVKLDRAQMVCYQGTPPISEGRPLSGSARLLRIDNQQAVYLLDDLGSGLTMRHCSSAEMFEALDFRWKAVDSVSAAEAAGWATGPALSLDTLLQAASSGTHYSTWMESHWAQLHSRSLKDLCLPGTHDSGTYQLFPTLTPDADDVPKMLWENARVGGATGIDAYITGMATTQSMSFYDQLRSGIRYLDLRVCHSDNDFYTCHSLRGNSLNLLLDDIKRFLDQTTKEVVLIKVGLKKMNAVLEQQAWDRIQSGMGNYFHRVDSTDVWTMTLDQIVTSGKRCLFLLDDVHIRGIYDSSANTNPAVETLLCSQTELVERYRSRSWYQIAGEGESFTVPRSITVRYGAGDKWITKTVSGTVHATPAYFGGDPAVGVVKSCQVSISGDITVENQRIWLTVADEGQDFHFPGSHTVRYGHVGHDWEQKDVSGSVNCGVAFFGRDPAENVLKVGQLLVSDTRLLEAQCFRPVGDENYVLGYVQKYGCRLLPVLPLLSGVPLVGSILAGIGLVAIPAYVTYLKNFDPHPTDLHENAKDSRSVLREYAAWSATEVDRRHPQLMICDFFEDVPLVDIAIRICTGQPYGDLCRSIVDQPKPRLSDPLATLECGAEAIAAAFKAAGYACDEAGNFLKDNIPGVTGTALAAAMKQAGYGAREAGDFLLSAYNFTEQQVNAALREAGYALSEVDQFFKKDVVEFLEDVGDVLNPLNWKI